MKQSVKAHWGQSYRAGVDWYVSSRHIVGFLWNCYHSDGERSEMRGVTTISPALGGVASSGVHTTFEPRDRGNQFTLNYMGAFRKPGQTLNIDLDYCIFRNTPWQTSEVSYFDVARIENDAAREYLRHSNPQNIGVRSAKIDFATPVWRKAKMEIGAKSACVTNDNNLRWEEQTGGKWMIDEGRTNHFGYREAIHAGYVSLNQNLGRVSLQAGLRGEYTDTKGEQHTTGEVTGKHYFDLFPTFYANWAISEKHRLGASYARRMMRPAYGQLNPFETKIDAYSFERGNPDLRPSYIHYIHNVSLTYTFSQSVMAKVDYSDMRDVIAQTPVREAGKYGLTRTNFGRRQTLTAMVNYRARPTKWWSINVMVMGLSGRDRSIEQFGKVEHSSAAVMIQMSNNFTITRSLSAELAGLYQTRERNTYLEMKALGNLAAGLRWSLAKGAVTVSLSGNDLLGSFHQNARSIVEGLDYSLRVRRDSRYVALGVRWNFNRGNDKGPRGRTSGIEDEKRRAQ